MRCPSLDDIVAQAITDAVARFGTDDDTNDPTHADIKDATHAGAGDASRDAAARDAGVVVLEARDVTWRDSSIGCPTPGISYLQRLTEGFLVVLRIGGRRVEYHSGPSGPARYCPNPQPPLPEGTPGFGPV